MNAIEQVRRTSVDSAAWEPCVTSDGRTIGEAEWLRRRTDGGWSHTAMLWRCEPTSFEYNFPGDESCLIISGVAHSSALRSSLSYPARRASGSSSLRPFSTRRTRFGRRRQCRQILLGSVSNG